MGFLSNLFGGSTPAKRQAPAAGTPSGTAPRGSGAPSKSPTESPQAVRKEVVRVAVKDTLSHAGIPLDWVRSDPLITQAPGRDAGISIRLVVAHWDPRLMIHAVALQNQVLKRLQALDPTADRWVIGVSWQFQLMDESNCPPLPHPGSWTAPPPDTDAMALAEAASGGSADVISGPTHIGTRSDARKDLEKLMAQGDAAFNKGGEENNFEKTQPMTFDKTRPMKM